MKQTDVKVPPILLEEDEPVAAPIGDQAEKFAVGPTAEPAKPESAESALSEGYGTGRLLLIARDPNCLYAHWDLTAEQQRDLNEKSAQGHLQVRVYREGVSGPLVKEVPVERESRHSFIEVEQSGARYVAELGYPPSDGPWQRIALSEPAVTPSDRKGEQQPIQFATLMFNADPGFKVESISPAGSFPAPVPVPEKSVEKTGPPTSALERHFPLPSQLPGVADRGPEFTETTRIGEEQQTTIPLPVLSMPDISSPAIPATIPALPPSCEWTAAQERALVELIGWSFLRRESLSSVEIADMMRGELRRAAVSLPGESSSIPPEAIAGPISSGALGILPPEQQGFWFNVNAELVIYGATERDAQVTLAGRPVELRPDGTFSCRFALPDGFYQLAIVATSAQGEVRRAELDFSRASVFRGEVGSHSQDPALKPPLAETTG